MTRYEVVVTREGRNWLATVPALSGTHSWARNLPALDREIREAIALSEDLPAGAEPSLQLSFEYRTGDPELDATAADLRADRAQLADLEATVGVRTGELIRILTQHGYSVRDTAKLVGVAPQRVSQVAPRSTRSDTVTRRLPKR